MSSIPTKMFFSSERADNYALSTNEISVVLGQNLMFYFCRLSSYVIPACWDNIITNYNDKLTFTEEDGDNTVIIPQGIYTISSLAAALKTALDVSSPGSGVYTVTPSLVTNHMNVTCTIPITYKPSLSTMGKIIGFLSTDTSTGTSLTGTNCFNITQNEIYLVCNLVKPVNVNSSKHRILDKIVVDKNFGYRLSNANIDSEFVSIDDESINQIEFSLIFADGTPVPMRAGWSCSIDFIAALP